MKQFAFVRSIAWTAVLATALSACGGGGGDSSSGGNVPPSGESRALQGAAVKGLIRNADVQVFELANDSLRVEDATLLGNGVVDSSGRYAMTVNNYHNGPVLLRIKGRTDGTTTVRCDAEPADAARICGVGKTRGEDIPVDSTFLIESFQTSLLADQANPINVSSFTHLIRPLAQELVSSVGTKAAILSASSRLRSLAGGADVVTTAPLDITQPPSEANAGELAYSALNAAALKLVPQGNTRRRGI